MGTTLTGAFISQTYDSLIKVTDNDNLTSTAKRLTDGLGNDSPLFLSTDKLGVGITPTTTFQVSGNSQLGGNLTVTGNLIVQGTTTTVDTDTLSVKDPLIIVGSDNTSSDAVDLGFYGVYDTSGSLDLFAGLFRDASDGKFHLFKDVQVEPTTTVNKSATGYTVATLVGNLEGTLTGTIASTTVATTQSASDNSTKVATTAYVDNQVTIQDLDFAGDSNTGTVDLDSQTFTIAGTSNEIETSASGQTLTVGLPSTVAITTKITSPIFGLGEGTSNKIQFIGSNGNWRINISDSANQFVIHSESLVADYFTVIGGGGIKLNAYGSGSKTGTVAKNLAVDSSGNIIETDGSVVDGSGTANDVVMWSDSNTLTDAPIAISGNDAIFAGGATFIDDVTIDNSSPEFFLTPDSAKYSWMIAAQENVDQHFEITPSTTVGGSTFNAPALKINGADNAATFAGDVTATSKKFISTSSSSGDYVRLYAGSGTAQWDIYGSGENLRLSENSSGGGIFQVDSGATFGGSITIPEYIIHSGDTDTFFGFVTDNEYKVTVGNSTKIFADANSAYLYHQGSVKINTTSGGVLVTGDINLTGTAIYKNSGTLEIKSQIINIKGVTTNENIAGFNENGSVDLYHDNSKKFETTSSGVSITGSVTADGVPAFIVGTIGAIGNTANDVNIYSTTSGHNGLRMHINGILPTDNSGTIIDNDADLGDPSYRFKDLYLGGNITAGGATFSDDVTIDNSGSGDRTLTLSTTTGGDPIIVMNSDASNRSGVIRYQDNGTNIGRIEYVHNGDKLQFQAGSATGQILELTNSAATFAGGVTITQNSGSLEFSNTGSGHGSITTGSSKDLNIGSGSGNVFINNNTTLNGSLSITADGSNAVTFTESGNGLMTVVVPDDFKVDCGSDIVLDAAGHDIRLQANGTQIGNLNMDSSNLNIMSSVQDKDILFKGNDGGSTITALTLDMSNGGSATFRDDIDFGGKLTQTGTGTNTFAGTIEHSSSATGNVVGALLKNTNQSGSADSVSLNLALGRTADTLTFSVPVIKLLKEQQWTGTGSTVDAALVFSTILNETIAEKMRLNSDGNLGILNSNPNAPLSFANSVATRKISLFEVADNNFQFYGFGVESNTLVYSTGDNGDDHVFFSGQSSSTRRELARFSGNGDILFGTSTKANDFTYLELATNNRRILNIGSSTVSQQTLVNFRNPNGVVGSVSTDGPTTSFSGSSDYRLKENVTPMTGSLDRVSQLKPSRFNFISDSERTLDGFLAHEVSDVVPQAIIGTKDEEDEDGNPVYQQIDHSKLVPLLVGAIQELKAEIEILKNK